jgi:hypothetical protein
MRLSSIDASRLFVVLISVATPAQAQSVARSYCSNPVHARSEKAPADLAPAVAKAFEIDVAAVGDATFVRCVGAKLMACYVGANLDCDKADTRRALPGATAWCRDNPGSQIIPMAATGHDTIYEWSCNGQRAVAGKAIATVDPHGYIAENWKEIR